MKFSRIELATAIAILFHLVGLIGILVFEADPIIAATPIHLLLMAGLIFYTQQKFNIYFLLFLLVCMLGGFAVEFWGIHTGSIFGNYQYGNTLGKKWRDVPLIIGVNWFIIIYICGVSIHMLLNSLRNKKAAEGINSSSVLRISALVLDSATLAVFLDWLMEPVAIKLDYWHWFGTGDIPIFNYVSWFVVSMVFLLVFHLLPFGKQNKFAVNLLLIQAMFFLILRTFL